MQVYILILKKTKNFSKKLKTLIDKGNISLEQYKNSKDAFIADSKDQKLRPHKINCAKNKSIIAIDIIDTQYRMLLNFKNCDEKFYIFSWIGKHREYEVIIKNKKNCKNLFIDCDEIGSLKELDEKYE